MRRGHSRLPSGLPNLVVDNNRVTSPSTNVNCFSIQSSFSADTDPAHFVNGKFRRNRLYLNGTRMEVKGCDGACEVTDNLIVGGYLLSAPTVAMRLPVAVGSGARIARRCRTTPIYNGTLQIGASSSGAMVENNAVTGSCTIGGTTTRNSNNLCNINAASAWLNAAAGNFTPANPGPLIGTASQTFFLLLPSAPHPGAPPTSASLAPPPSTPGRLRTSGQSRKGPRRTWPTRPRALAKADCALGSARVGVAANRPALDDPNAASKAQVPNGWGHEGPSLGLMGVVGMLSTGRLRTTVCRGRSPPRTTGGR